MARFVLLLLASIAFVGVTIGVSSSDEDHSTAQRRALVRETLENGAAMVLDASIHPKQKTWQTSPSIDDEFKVDGRRVTIEDYHLEEGGQVVAFTLRADLGDQSVRQTSRYRLEQVAWPGPLWIDAPYATAQVDPKARINGSSPDGNRSLYFDATRFDAYGLNSVLDLAHLSTDLGAPLAGARGDHPSLRVEHGMEPVLTQYGTPSLIEVAGRALAEFSSGDVRLAGGTVLNDKVSYGGEKKNDDSRIVHVTGDLTIGPSGDVRGGGLLLVDGNLVVEGRLRWGGIVMVRPQGQHVVVDFERGSVEIEGSLVVDQEAPPPGGHTDMTINRDLTGVWATPIGQTGPGTPGHAEFGALAASYGFTGLFYDHEHRIDHTIAEVRKFSFAERGNDRHEAYTRFRRTLNDLTAQNPNQEVYLRFKNPSVHGAALFTLVAAGETYSGSVASGFGSDARPGDAWASPAFRPADLDTLIVDVQSLRMLKRLVDKQRPDSPFWTYGSTVCPSRPLCLGNLPDRDGALAVQLVRATDDKPVYEASIYWHTHAVGTAEYKQELAADNAWRDAIRSGTAEYGAVLKLGEHTKLDFDSGQVGRTLSRLGFNRLDIQHVASFVEQL